MPKALSTDQLESARRAPASEREEERMLRVYRAFVLPRRECWSLDNLGNQAIEQERWAVTRMLLEHRGLYPLSGQTILEVGCGSGKVLGQLLGLGAEERKYVGVDLLPERLAEARLDYPTAGFQVANAEHLAFGDQTFDVVVASTLFSSLWTTGGSVAAEIQRVLKPHGVVIFYDFRYASLSNPYVHRVSRKDIAELFPDLTLELRSVTLLPPIARRLGPSTVRLYQPLRSIPFLRSHYVGLLHR